YRLQAGRKRPIGYGWLASSRRLEFRDPVRVDAFPRVWYLNPGVERQSTNSEVLLVMFESYGITDTGCVRSENQDRILIDHSTRLFMVADGMGGHKHGEIAAEMAVNSLRYYVETSRYRF